MTAEQIMFNFQSGRLVDALAFIGTIIAIWLALRVANMTGENPASNLVTKLVSTGFCACVIAGSWQAYTFAANTFIFAARRIQENIENAPNPEAAQNFIDYVGTTQTATTPTPLGIAFLAIVTIMLISLIWLPRNN
tara:strand:- start:60 stop:467 length:408 start_codon:yes stop_codon:yes gene_type:complete